MVIGQAVWLSSRMWTWPPNSPTSTRRGLPAGESSTASVRCRDRRRLHFAVAVHLAEIADSYMNRLADFHILCFPAENR